MTPDAQQRTASTLRAWQDCLAAVRRAADRLDATEGRETVEDLNLRHLLARLSSERFPVGPAMAQATAASFLTLAKALTHPDAKLPSLRARLAPAAIALAVAVDGLLADQMAEDTRPWRERIGEA